MTNNLLDKSQALADKAKNRRLQLASDEKNKKIAQWQDCQEKTPEIASILIELNKAFGKPTAVKVEFNGEVILKNGNFAEAKDLSVKKYSQQREKFKR